MDRPAFKEDLRGLIHFPASIGLTFSHAVPRRLCRPFIEEGAARATSFFHASALNVRKARSLQPIAIPACIRWRRVLRLGLVQGFPARAGDRELAEVHAAGARSCAQASPNELDGAGVVFGDALPVARACRVAATGEDCRRQPFVEARLRLTDPRACLCHFRRRSGLVAAYGCPLTLVAGL